TGERNPLGWTPPDFNDGYWDAYAVNAVIQSVKYSPLYPDSGEEVAVTARLSLDSSMVDKVTLRYSVDRGEYRSVEMVRAGSGAGLGSVYRGVIPGQPAGTVVDFQVSVLEKGGDASESGVLSYKVEKGGGGGGWDLEIPGFPFESIVAGLALGAALLYYLSRRKVAIRSPGSGAGQL
ncbi:MAG: hypothetical protein QFX35_05805, partial [Candidatus Verstraetearchaeota archaeon]|nr:hypothetical protein [Candidatus Verstraetearchaeota archaeon]